MLFDRIGLTWIGYENIILNVNWCLSYLNSKFRFLIEWETLLQIIHPFKPFKRAIWASIRILLKRLMKNAPKRCSINSRMIIMRAHIRAFRQLRHRWQQNEYMKRPRRLIPSTPSVFLRTAVQYYSTIVDAKTEIRCVPVRAECSVHHTLNFDTDTPINTKKHANACFRRLRI